MRSLPVLSRSVARGPLFAVSAALSLLVALLCALLPTGLASSNALGSAFSPSTAVVSLKAPGQARIVSKRFEADGDAGKTVVAERMIREKSAGLFAPAGVAFAFAPAPEPPRARAGTGPTAWPRAPPAA